MLDNFMTTNQQNREKRVNIVSDTQGVLLVCSCNKKCNPSYFTLDDLDGKNIILHHVNEENNKLGFKGDIVRTSVAQLRQSAYKEAREEVLREVIEIIKKRRKEVNIFSSGTGNMFIEDITKKLKQLTINQHI